MDANTYQKCLEIYLSLNQSVGFPKMEVFSSRIEKFTETDFLTLKYNISKIDSMAYSLALLIRDSKIDSEKAIVRLIEDYPELRREGASWFIGRALHDSR